MESEERQEPLPVVKQEVDENTVQNSESNMEIPENEETILNFSSVFILCTSCVSSKLTEQNQLDGEVVENNVIVCAICRVHCRSTNVIENQFLLEAGGESESVQNEPKTTDLKCTSCHDNSPATSWCVECSEYICDGCVQAHQRLKITKEHTIKPKEEAEQENHASASSSVPKNLYCSVHRQESLSLFCETCDKLTCRDCQLTDHRDHKYKFIHEIAEETKSMISGLLSEVSYKRVLLTSAMKVIDDRQALIVDKKKTLVKEITNMVVKLTNAISSRGKQLVLQLNEVCDAKQRTLKEKKIALEQLSNLTDHCIEFVNNALNKGSDMALLYSKRTVTQHLQRIKSRRADIPNPEIPVRILVAMDKLPELVKVVSGIGGIVVDGRVYTSPGSLIPVHGPPPYPQNQQQQPTQQQQSQQQQPQSHQLQQPGQQVHHQQQQQQQQHHQQRSSHSHHSQVSGLVPQQSQATVHPMQQNRVSPHQSNSRVSPHQPHQSQMPMPPQMVPPYLSSNLSRNNLTINHKWQHEKEQPIPTHNPNSNRPPPLTRLTIETAVAITRRSINSTGGGGGVVDFPRDFQLDQ
ncbi:hypothetical protein L9F63_011058, partial [Diploptera punctata]